MSALSRRAESSITPMAEPSQMERLHVGPFEIALWRRGSGPIALLLHGANPVSPDAAFVER